jgi:DNA-binding transcriptional LysR family regulator
MVDMTELHRFDAADLRVFCEVARLGSFTAAAGALGYTQSGVSRRIAALERAAGGPLFERRPRGVRLGPAGRALHRYALDVLDRLQAAGAELDAIRSGTGGRLRVGSFPTANAALLPCALRLLRRDRPEVTTTVVEGLTVELLERLRTGGLDLAVVSDYPSGIIEADDLRLVHLGDDPLLVALVRTHRLAAADGLRLGDLAGETWIESGTHGTGTVLQAACARAGFTPRIDITVHSWIAKLGFTAAGLGVTLVPGLAADARRRDLALRPLPGDIPSRRVFAALPAGDDPLPAALRLVEDLRRTAAEHRERFG